MIRVHLARGARFGLLTVVREGARRGPSRRRTYLCRCNCGVEREISFSKLRAGTALSCGCSRKGKGRPVGAKNGSAPPRKQQPWVWRGKTREKE
jgi:hypothetical protein